jgi:hypothetical protein
MMDGCCVHLFVCFFGGEFVEQTAGSSFLRGWIIIFHSPLLTHDAFFLSHPNREARASDEGH